MQPNLDSYSLASRAIALPVPKPDRITTIKRTLPTTFTHSSELERARQSVVGTSIGEQIAWAAVTLSAVTVLGLSFWI